jgi:hypothetical protein
VGFGILDFGFRVQDFGFRVRVEVVGLIGT